MGAVMQSIKRALCSGQLSFNKKEGISMHLLTKSLSSQQRRLKRRNCEKGIELTVCFGWEDNQSINPIFIRVYPRKRG